MVILVSCKYCGGLHERGTICKSKPSNQKVVTKIDRFRWSQPWKDKRIEINKRDRYLCLVCLEKEIYNYIDISVHHIDELAKCWRKRLDDSNLITVCRECHEEAEKGNIPKEYLFKLVEKSEGRGSR